MTSADLRATTRAIASAVRANGEPLRWFEKLYAEARVGRATVPWAGLVPNPHLVSWVPLEALPAVVISFNSAGLYLGQAIGAALGGIMLDHDATARVLCLTGVGIAMAAAGVHAWASATSRREAIG